MVATVKVKFEKIMIIVFRFSQWQKGDKTTLRMKIWFSLLQCMRSLAGIRRTCVICDPVYKYVGVLSRIGITLLLKDFKIGGNLTSVDHELSQVRKNCNISIFSNVRVSPGLGLKVVRRCWSNSCIGKPRYRPMGGVPSGRIFWP
jgi:hypothetical protein